MFLTMYICTINLLLLFDNTTGMTHLKMFLYIYIYKLIFIFHVHRNYNRSRMMGLFRCSTDMYRDWSQRSWASYRISLEVQILVFFILQLNLLKPNDIYIYIYISSVGATTLGGFWPACIYIYICSTAALTSRRYILNVYSTNIRTEYFKHAA